MKITRQHDQQAFYNPARHTYAVVVQEAPGYIVECGSASSGCVHSITFLDTQEKAEQQARTFVS